MSSIFSSITSPAWIGVWFLVEFVSIVVIVAGCAIELYAELHKFKDNVVKSPASERLVSKLTGDKIKERWKLTGAGIVVLGLSVELIAFGLSYLASNKQILELQAKLQPRAIKNEQRRKFIELLKGIPKFPIKVFCPDRDNEAYRYAVGIRTMLNDAGYGTNGEKVIETLGYVREMVDAPKQFSEADIACLWYGTNEMTTLFKPGDVVQMSTNRFVLVNTNAAFVFVIQAFRSIQIQTGSGNDDTMLKPGEFEVYVPPKVH